MRLRTRRVTARKPRVKGGAVNGGVLPWHFKGRGHGSARALVRCVGSAREIAGHKRGEEAWIGLCRVYSGAVGQRVSFCTLQVRDTIDMQMKLAH